MYFHSPFLRQSAKSASARRLCSASGGAAGRQEDRQKTGKGRKAALAEHPKLLGTGFTAAHENVPEILRHQTARRGTTKITPAAAARASRPPKLKAVADPQRSQRAPKRSEAGSAPTPMARLDQPKAAPRRFLGTRSATSALSTPSVRPK